MFVPFLIMLREGLEAALIVSLIASYLKRTQRGNWIGVMWIGVILAAALCLGLGIFINETTGEFPQREQELFEGIVAVIAVVILTWMVFWMRNVSRLSLIHILFSTFIVLSVINPTRPGSEQEIKLEKLHESQRFFEMLGEYILAGFKAVSYTHLYSR